MASAAPPKYHPGVDGIEDQGWKWRLETNYPIEKLSQDRRVQTRGFGSGRWCPPEERDRIATAMEYNTFPPIIVTKDDWLGDGNTRVGAYVKRKIHDVPAIVVDFDWGSATDLERKRLLTVMRAINAAHGRPPTKVERKQMVADMLALDYRLDIIAGQSGVPESQIKAIKQEQVAEKRIEDVGLNINGDLQVSAMRALGKQDAVVLHDKPYRELVKVVADAGLASRDVNDLVAQAKRAGSDEEAVKVFEKAREDAKDQIILRRMTGKVKVPPSRQLRQAMGGVLKWEGKERDVVEVRGELAEEHISMLERMVTFGHAVLQAQQLRLVADEQ
jgi:hypothetical protein